MDLSFYSITNRQTNILIFFEETFGYGNSKVKREGFTLHFLNGNDKSTFLKVFFSCHVNKINLILNFYK